MRITALRTFLVPPRWLFLKLETDEGVSGWGEPVLEGHARTCAAKVAEWEPQLIGRDPRRVNDLFQMLYRQGCYRGGPILMSALSGIEMACWDVAARALGVPVHAMLGGRVRDRIRAYAWMGGDRAETLDADLAALRAQGYRAAKFNVAGETPRLAGHAAVDAIAARVFALREAAGSEFDLAIDFHGRIDAAAARVLLAELEPARPLFVEDAVLQTQMHELADLARATPIPLAAGERLTDRAAFRDLFAARGVRVANPDIAHIGGIGEMVRLGHMAELHDVALAPHCPLGPIALAASMQVNAVCHAAAIQEHAAAIHYNAGVPDGGYLSSGRMAVEDGHLAIPEGPGLGIEVDEAAVMEAAARGHGWRPPLWRHVDGSVAEW